MEDSVTYQAIIAKGRALGIKIGERSAKADEARSILLRIGTKRLGPPDAGARSSIEAITGVEQLEVLAERVIDAQSWQDVLAGL